MTIEERRYTFADGTTSYPCVMAETSLWVMPRAGIVLDPTKCGIAKGLEDLGFPKFEVLQGRVYVLHPDGIVRMYILGAAGQRVVDRNDKGERFVWEPVLLLAPSPSETLAAKREIQRRFKAKGGATNPQGPNRNRRPKGKRRIERAGAVRLDYVSP